MAFGDIFAVVAIPVAIATVALVIKQASNPDSVRLEAMHAAH
jgi:hypothetical protein